MSLEFKRCTMAEALTLAGQKTGPIWGYDGRHGWPADARENASGAEFCDGTIIVASSDYSKPGGDFAGLDPEPPKWFVAYRNSREV